ncbi:MAG: hypothetical protein COV26_01335 [Candidatus Nealsonbacteria bacterium CG10_big_fil_rev_8_21_14_0_10_36_23]|uniref:Uncharacterized protein n=1 Tax=Candidatus Nealsonbacteria bacterium CG10_big_fil_rev_8_21_14_0_10_36_23 TaxID=1974709 RepID=A0A2H0TL87_9BACT|nr:MAG: hypothetical protein COV26_01335 [Candidatus Nealsonbacteria bacterium CG10_big_fil_rev_8_21_14_0_10_36_23]
MNKKLLIILIVVILVAAGLVYYFWYQKGKKTGLEVTIPTLPKAAVTNPLEKMPETNPFDKAINPFKTLYKNPFK